MCDLGLHLTTPSVIQTEVAITLGGWFDLSRDPLRAHSYSFPHDLYGSNYL